MKNVVNLLKKAIKDMRVSFVGDRIPMDPDTIRSLRSRIRMDLLPYCEGRSMIPVDRSANCEDWIYDPNGSGIQILGIRSRDPFSGSTDMSGCDVAKLAIPRYLNNYLCQIQRQFSQAMILRYIVVGEGLLS